MADFTTRVDLEVAIDSRSLRAARGEIEDELGGVTVGVSPEQQQFAAMQAGGGGGRGNMGLGGGVGGDLLNVEEEQLDVLEDIQDQTDGLGGVGGGGGGFLGGGGGGPATVALTAGTIASLGTTVGAAAAGGIAFAGLQFGLQNIVAGLDEDAAQVIRDRQTSTSPEDAGFDVFRNFLDPLGLGETGLKKVEGLLSGPGAGPGFNAEERAALAQGKDGPFSDMTSALNTFINQTPAWLSTYTSANTEFAQAVQLFQSLQAPDRPANLPSDPSDFGEPPGTGSGGGGARGPGNCGPGLRWSRNLKRCVPAGSSAGLTTGDAAQNRREFRQRDRNRDFTSNTTVNNDITVEGSLTEREKREVADDAADQTRREILRELRGGRLPDGVV